MSLLDELSDRDEASASEDDLVDEEEVSFPGFQKTLMKIRSEGSNGANSPAEAAAKSESSTAANSPRSSEPKIEAEDKKAVETENGKVEPMVNGVAEDAATKDAKADDVEMNDSKTSKNVTNEADTSTDVKVNENTVSVEAGTEVPKDPEISSKLEGSETEPIRASAEANPNSETGAEKDEPVMPPSEIKTEPEEEKSENKVDSAEIKTEVKSEIKTEVKEEADAKVKEEKPIRIKQ